MNVIAAVIVDRQAQARLDDEKLQYQMQEEELHKSYAKLKALFSCMDDDDSGCLTLDELVSSFSENDEFEQVLKMVGIGEHDIPTLFGVLDKNGSGDVSYEEFVTQLHFLRTANQRTALVFIKHIAGEIQETLSVHSELLQRFAQKDGMTTVPSKEDCQMDEVESLTLLQPTSVDGIGEDSSLKIGGGADQAPSSLTAGLQDHLKKLSDQILADMRQLLEASAEHSRVLVGVRSSVEKHGANLVQLAGRRSPLDPWSSDRLLPSALDLPLLEREGYTEASLVRSLLSEPSDASMHAPGASTSERLVAQEWLPSPTSLLAAQERAAPPQPNLRTLGTCCAPQPNQVLPKVQTGFGAKNSGNY